VAGLYWVGSIGHSMLVLLPGAILSKYSVRCCHITIVRKRHNYMLMIRGI